MTYDLEWLENFSGELRVEEIDLEKLAHTTEKYVSQIRYTYQTDDPIYPEIKIEVANANIPHLMGLSYQHHVGLPTKFANSIFEGLKDDWTLENLMSADTAWFENNRYKVVGVYLLYQILNLKECQVFTTQYTKRTAAKKRFDRDNIYFIVFKLASEVKYTLEIAASDKEENLYTPRSLKINDKNIEDCSLINIRLIKKERLKKPLKVKKVKWKT